MLRSMMWSQARSRSDALTTRNGLSVSRLVSKKLRHRAQPYPIVQQRLQRFLHCDDFMSEQKVKLVMPEPAEVRRHWFALFTATNNEKKVEQHLRMKEIETFLPLYTATRRWKNRTTAKVELPLFTGYVFAKIARTQTALVLSVPMVYSIVGNKHGALPLPDAEIDTLRLGLNSVEADPHPYIKIGQRARIRNGPLAGLEGIVERTDDHLRVVLTIDLIMKSIAVRVSREDIDICEELVREEPVRRELT